MHSFRNGGVLFTRSKVHTTNYCTLNLYVVRIDWHKKDQHLDDVDHEIMNRYSDRFFGGSVGHQPLILKHNKKQPQKIITNPNNISSYSKMMKVSLLIIRGQQRCWFYLFKLVFLLLVGSSLILMDPTTTSSSGTSSLFCSAFQQPHQQLLHQTQQTALPSPLLPVSSSSFSLYVSFTPEEATAVKDDQDPVFFPLINVPTPTQIPTEPQIEPVSAVVANDNQEQEPQKKKKNVFDDYILNTYWGPRITLVVIAIVYATNFPLGAIMAQHLPASAATSSRMVLAALALSPFLPRIKPHLRWPSILCGCGTALGYVTQSLALVDTDPSKVSFLGAATVLWCPFLEWAVEKKPMGLKQAPQTWLAALLCLLGVGVLEGVFATNTANFQQGDILAIVQAMGFGTGCFLSSRMVQKEPDQVLPITSVLIATTAFWSMLWSLWDGWMFTDSSSSFALPNLLFTPGMETVAMAVVWTGLISTSLNFFIEISALGRVPPSEASVLLASEPLWAALLAATVFHQSNFDTNDYVGGICILLACLANALLKPSDFENVFGTTTTTTTTTTLLEAPAAATTDALLATEE